MVPLTWQALASIRREIEKQKRGIQESLRGHLRRLAEGGAVQDELITIRGERFVIPVKAEQKRRVQGVVHGASSSGRQFSLSRWKLSNKTTNWCDYWMRNKRKSTASWSK